MVSQSRALLVDDDSSWQQILREILEDMDLVVDSASSYAGATKLLSEPHRLAIVDLCLVESDHHNQDGIRIADAIKSRDPDCVILMLTGHATVELAVSVLTEHGVSNCLRKEIFQRGEFKRLIQRSLEAAPVKTVVKELETSRKLAELGEEVRRGQSLKTGSDVLIVEDDAGWRGILHELLTETGFRVRAATSFGEALGCLRRGRYALAVVDLSLAGPAEERLTRSGAEGELADLEGYRLLATIQSSGTPVIVLSGLTDPDRIESAIAALIPRTDWTHMSHVVIWHGRRCCHAKKPACGACPLARLCPSFGEGPTDPAVAAALLRTEGPA